MAPRKAKKIVVRSTKKVVESSVEITVGRSSKRLTRSNLQNQIGEGEVEALGQESVRVIPIQEVIPPQAKEEDHDASTTTSTTENKAEQESTQNGEHIQNQKAEQTRDIEEVNKAEQNKDIAEVKKAEQNRDILEAEENRETVEAEQNRGIEKKQGKKAKRTRKGNQGKEKKKTKRGKRSEEGYQRYVYRVLKQVHPDMGISGKAMTILNNFMNDMFEKLTYEASKLKDYTGHMTLTSREIQGAVRLVLPGELGKHAISEGVKAVTRYTSYA